jgi:diacylglycerol kinase
MLSFIRSRWDSIKIAFKGFIQVLSTEKNTWVHTTATVLVFGLGLWLSLSTLEWAGLVLAVGLVWIAEFFNTALEVLVNMVSPDSNPLAKTCKDISAGAVLIAAVISIVVGILILGPPLWQKITQLFLS